MPLRGSESRRTAMQLGAWLRSSGSITVSLISGCPEVVVFYKCCRTGGRHFGRLEGSLLGGIRSMSNEGIRVDLAHQRLGLEQEPPTPRKTRGGNVPVNSSPLQRRGHLPSGH